MSLVRGRMQPIVAGAIAAFSFVVIASFFSLGGIDWIEDTDSGWFWRNSQNPVIYDPHILPGYTTIIWLFSQLLPRMEPVILMQGISLVCYVGSTLLTYHLLVKMGVSLALHGALLLALFPLTGVANAVMPRVDAMTYLVCMALCYTYVTDRKVVLLALFALGFILHYSIWPFAGLLLLVGLHERKIEPWTIPFMVLPLVCYHQFGVLRNGDWTWFLSGLGRGVSKEGSYPLMDGLIGSFEQGLSGEMNKLARGLVVLVHLILALLMLYKRVWRTNRFLLATILTPILLGITRIRSEIWSMRDYTMYLAIPIVVWLGKRHFSWLQSTRVWAGIFVACFLSQFVWAYYVVHVGGG